MVQALHPLHSQKKVAIKKHLVKIERLKAKVESVILTILDQTIIE